MATKVRDGIVLTNKRQALIYRYRDRHRWLYQACRWGREGEMQMGSRWTSRERAEFRKWRRGFMRPMK